MALSIGELTGFLSMDASGFTDAAQRAMDTLKSKDWKKFGAAAGVMSAGALATGFASEVNMQSAVNKTAAQLNLTGPEAEKAGNVAGTLYRDGLGTSMEEVSGATGSVIAAFSGLRNSSEADIEAASRSALMFASAMEVDVGGAAQTAGILVESGLADNAQQAFDLMTRGAQAVGPDMVQPLMEASNEYSKHFAMLGYDGDQAMSVLAEAAKGGEISLDKAGDAVKEFGIRATDLGDTGAQEALSDLGLSGTDMANALLAGGEEAQNATKTITDALLAVEDPAERARLASGLFGTQIEDLGKDELPAFLAAMGQAEGSLGDVEGATASMGETMSNDAGTKLRQFGRLVQTELMALAGPAVEWLTPMVEELGRLQPYIQPVVIGLGAIALAVGAAQVATSLYNGALAVKRGALAASTAAQWAMNTALLASPITWIVLAIGALVAGLVLFFTKTETGKAIWEKVWGGIKAVAGAVAGWFTGTVWPMLQKAWDGIAAGALWLWQNAIKPAWEGIRTGIAVVAEWVTGTLVPWLQAAWETLSAGMTWLWESIVKPVWEGIRVAIALVVAAVMTYFDAVKWYINNVLAPVFTWLWKNVITPVWNGIRTAISAVVNWFKGTAVPFIQQAVGVARQVFENFREGLRIIWAAVQAKIIQPVLSWFQTYVVGGFRTAVATVRAVFDAFRAGLGIIWGAVRSRVIEPVVNWFRDQVVSRFRSAANTVRDLFDSLRARLGKAWSAIRHNVIQPVVSWLQDKVVGTINRATDKVEDAFFTMRDSVKKAWDSVKETAKAPIRFVVETVINNGIVSNFNKIAGKFGVKKLPTVSVGFASGGVLPGYTPGRDVHSFYSPALGRLDLSGGEAIMRPEFTRAVGGAAGVARLNMAARNGSIRADAFASGGVWQPRHAYAGGGVLDWIKDKGSLIRDAISDPKGTMKSIAEHYLSGIPGAGVMLDMAKNAALKVATDAGNFLFGKQDTAAASGSGKMGTGGSLSWASGIARKHGLTMTSGYRPGARTSSGSMSMHGQNRARDYSNSSGPTPQMMAFFNEVLAGSRPTELLYSPAGARNVHRGGRQYANTGNTKRIHYNHVHVAYKDGGVLGDALGKGYRGGTIAATPGWHMVGEDGPELLRLRGGEQVKSTSDTERLLGGRSLSDEDVDRIAQAVREGAADGSREGVGDGMSGGAARARTTARMGAL